MPKGYVRLAFETTPGNEVNDTEDASGKVLFPPLIRFAPRPGTAHLERDDELRNQDEPLAVVPERYEPTWEAESRLYPDSIGFLLSLALGKPDTVPGGNDVEDLAGNPVPTGAYRHRWTAPFGPAGPYPQTATADIAYVDQGAYFVMRGMAAAELGISTPEEGGARVTVSGPATYLNTQANPNRTPAYESLAVRPFTRGNLQLVDNMPGIGTVEDFSLNITNPVAAHRSLGVASLWPDVMEKDDEGPVVVSGEMPVRQLNAAVIEALRDATGFELLAVWESPSEIAATGRPYSLAVHCANAQFTEGDPDELANRRRHGHSLTFKSTTESVGSTTVELVNATQSY